MLLQSNLLDIPALAGIFAMSCILLLKHITNMSVSGSFFSLNLVCNTYESILSKLNCTIIYSILGSSVQGIANYLWAIVEDKSV